MRLSEHLKLAIFTGLIIGMFTGIVDIIARIIILRFEWFEFYQTLLISSALSITGFIIICFFIEVIKGIVKLNITKKTLSLIYFGSILPLLFLFYGEIFVNLYLFSFISQRYLPTSLLNDPFRFTASLAVGLTAVLIYFFLLTKGKNFVFYFLSFAKREKIKNFIKNFIFILGLFIIISFFIDAYVLYYIPSSTSDRALNGYPNILLITLDTVRADHLSLYDYYMNTSPNLENFAKDSVVFDNAVSPSSWTIPSHASIFTGKYPSNHNAIMMHQKLVDKERTLAEILKERGYNTVGFAGGAFCKAKYGMGQGFITYKDRLDFFEYMNTYDRFSIRPLLYMFFPNLHDFIFNTDRERSSEEINKDVFEWFDKNGNSTFFMFINYFDAHSPYNRGDVFKERFTSETRDYSEVREMLSIKRYENVSEDILNYTINLYDTEIFYLDYHLGKLFDKLDELDLRNNTIIIITADHGEEFYDHGRFDHGQTLYEEVIHVPLIIYYPKEFEAQRIEKRVGIINIFPTILDILQIEVPENIDSVNLLPLIKNGADYNREYVLSQLFGRLDRPELNESNQQSISYGDWKLIKIRPEQETLPSSLFNLKSDLKEQNNLYDKYPEKRELLQRYIVDIVENI